MIPKQRLISNKLPSLTVNYNINLNVFLIPDRCNFAVPVFRKVTNNQLFSSELQQKHIQDPGLLQTSKMEI